MAKYVTKRVLLAIATVFIVCGITFFSMNAIPGGPFDGEKALSPEVKEALEKRFNLDKPVPEQFVLYLENLVFPQKQEEILKLQFLNPLKFPQNLAEWQLLPL